ncbi:FkbM family methyltransferase [Bradyrhizobium genosp. L]|uniref:FkbM family methyltransferase n=1 Tax=Bradyrhizobium genosp. L TaxID=83637 RepID=UPI0018A317A0|nr:FkbM family methyltransferase [Bradyrhizobium genosp. L]QPF87115.1 FkbM family methyltransferase [Bradyrhizobium genosp. L]
MKLEIAKRIRTSPIYSSAMWAHDLQVWVRATRKGSFSQHGEDRFIRDFFTSRKTGVYLDIGASHPFKISNTYLLYRSGWKGVTVEPIPRLGALHRRWRPRDKLLPVGVGTTAGELEFFEMLPSVLSTLDASVANEYIAQGKATLLKKYHIPVLTIDQVIRQTTEQGQVDFLSIDIEGLDADVINSIDYSRFRPSLICVEIISSETRETAAQIFDRAGYKIVNEIGCNLFVSPA